MASCSVSTDAPSSPVNVLIVHQTPLHRLGGAELSLRHHVERRPSRITVQVVAPSARVDLEQFDAVVLGNLRPMDGPGEAAEAASARDWAERLATYTGARIKSERDVHPCCHRDARCLDFPRLAWNRDCTRSRIRAAYRALYDRCDIIQVLSPLHRSVIDRVIDSPTPRRVIASPVDLTAFTITTPPEDRPRQALILGDEPRVDDDAETAAIEQGFEPVRIDYLSVPHHRVPSLLNRFGAVVVRPRMFHAFGRIVVEALACGCRVIGNHRVGALSWPDPVAASQRANDEFWKLLQGMVARRRPQACR